MGRLHEHLDDSYRLLNDSCIWFLILSHVSNVFIVTRKKIVPRIYVMTRMGHTAAIKSSIAIVLFETLGRALVRSNMSISFFICFCIPHQAKTKMPTAPRICSATNRPIRSVLISGLL